MRQKVKSPDYSSLTSAEIEQIALRDIRSAASKIEKAANIAGEMGQTSTDTKRQALEIAERMRKARKDAQTRMK